MRPQDLLDRLAAGYEYDPMYGALCNERDQLKAENAKLRELCADLYVLCYEHEVGWKLADSTWEKYEPCDLCKERHGGKSPCASTSRDMSEECCDPYQAELFAKCMAALGIEVPS